MLDMSFILRMVVCC